MVASVSCASRGSTSMRDPAVDAVGGARTLRAQHVAGPAHVVGGDRCGPPRRRRRRGRPVSATWAVVGGRPSTRPSAKIDGLVVTPTIAGVDQLAAGSPTADGRGTGRRARPIRPARTAPARVGRLLMTMAVPLLGFSGRLPVDSVVDWLVSAAATTASGVKPNSRNSVLSSADAPKCSSDDDLARCRRRTSTSPGRCRPRPRPGRAPSGAARCRGRPASCASNHSTHGIDTTRVAMPSACERSRAPPPRAAPRSRCAIRITSGCPPDGLGQHVAAAGDALGRLACRRSRTGTFCRVRTDRSGRWWRLVQDGAPGQAVSLASAGRTTASRGIARSAARCSTGWWVGPSSPRPIESCVQT